MSNLKPTSRTVKATVGKQSKLNQPVSGAASKPMAGGKVSAADLNSGPTREGVKAYAVTHAQELLKRHQ